MARVTRNATAIVVTIFATAVTQPRATAAEPPPGPKETQAEIQISLCAPTDQIVQALDLRPRGTPINVWQFDDPALTSLGADCAFAFGWQRMVVPNSR